MTAEYPCPGSGENVRFRSFIGGSHTSVVRTPGASVAFVSRLMFSVSQGQYFPESCSMIQGRRSSCSDKNSIQTLNTRVGICVGRCEPWSGCGPLPWIVGWNTASSSEAIAWIGRTPRLEGQRGLMMVTRCCFVLTRWVARFKRRGSLIFVKYDTAS